MNRKSKTAEGSFGRSLFAHALAGIVFITAPAHANPASELIQDLARTLKPMQSALAKAEGSSIVAEAAGLPDDYLGAFLAVTDKDGARMGVARITAVNKGSALCRAWISKGKSWPAGPLRVQGFKPPVRTLFIFSAPAGSPAAQLQDQLFKSAGETLAILPLREDISYLFAGSSPERLAKAAGAKGAELIILPFVKTAEGAGEYGFTLLDSAGVKLADFSSKPETSRPDDMTVPHPYAQAGMEAKDPPSAAPKPEGFLAGQKSPIRAERIGPEPKPVTAEEDVEYWDAIRVDGRVLSAALYYVGGVVARDLAILTADRLILAGVGPDGGLKTKWISPTFAGLTPINLSAFDTNGDGREEIFVNAVRSGGFRSMLFDDSDKGYRMMAGDLPYYFSSTPGWGLLAQRMGAEGKVDGAFFRVSREEGDLRMDPAGSIEGDAPLGLYGFDPDEDGVMELAGALGDGTTAIYSLAGKLLWSAEGLAEGGKKYLSNGEEGSKRNAFPRLVPLKDKSGKPMLAAGATEEVAGGFLGSGAKSSGLARMIRILPDGYKAEKTMLARRAWISDLIDMGGGPLGTNSHPGYVAIGEEEGNSVIYVPMEREEAEAKSASSGSFGAPSPPAPDRE